MAGVVFDAGAVSCFPEHLKVIVGAGFQAGGFKQLFLLFQLGESFFKLLLNAFNSLQELFLRGDKVPGGINVHRVQFIEKLTGQGVDLNDTLNIVAEKLNAQSHLLVGGLNFQGIAANTKLAAGEVNVVAGVLHIDQFVEELAAVKRLTTFEGTDKFIVFLRLTETIDTGHRGNNEHVAPLKKRAGSGVTELVNLLVDFGFFFNIEVVTGDISLGLVVVVIADEILDGVIGEELLELGVELGAEGLVVADNEGRSLDAGDNISHGEGLAAAGNSEQGLFFVVFLQTCYQFIHCLWLVAGHCEIGD